MSLKESTAPISLTHVFNSSDNFKEELWFDEDMFFNKMNPTKMNTVISDDDVYFDEMNEEVPSGLDNIHNSDSNSCNNDSDSNSNSEDKMPDESDNDDEYDGYSEYNEYSKCDRGHYYRDERYERKSSSMMSLIISLVTT